LECDTELCLRIMLHAIPMPKVYVYKCHRNQEISPGLNKICKILHIPV
jgi:hypothetical protein